MSTTDYLSSISFGTATGGAAGAAETTTTLGTARLDRQVPPSQYQVSGLQISRLVELAIAMSAHSKGGTRLKVIKQTSNPFSAAESGFYISAAGSAFTVVDGVATAIGGGGGGTTQTIDVINATAATGKSITSAVANAGTNVGLIFNNSTTLSGTTLLASFRNNGTEKLAVDNGGALVTPGTMTLSAGAGSVYALSGSADGPSAVGLSITSVATWANTSAKLLDVQNGFASVFYVAANGQIVTTLNTSAIAVGGLTEGFGYFSGAMYFYAGGSAVVNLGSAALAPQVDLGLTSGASGKRWSETWSRRYAGVEQTVAAAATISLDPALGETIRITLGATGITTINGAAGYPGEVIRVEVIQDGSGGRTISGWSTGANGFQFSSTAYTVTATASKRDLITFAWDSVAAKWIEQSRSMGM